MDSERAEKRPVGILLVKVKSAIKLKNKLLGTFDPYVKLKLTEDDKLHPRKTDVFEKNSNPVWNEKFDVPVHNPETQSIELNVLDWKKFGIHEKIGMNVVPLREFIPDEPKVMTLDLLKSMDPNDLKNGKSMGHLVVEFTYKPFEENKIKDDLEDSNEIQKALSSGGLLIVVIHEAENIEGQHHTNPYASLLFRGEENKTKVVKRNGSPRWGEEFKFMLDQPPLNDKLHVQVVSIASRLGRNRPQECLGYVDINLNDIVFNKRIKEKFKLIDSKNGTIDIEILWRSSA